MSIPIVASFGAGVQSTAILALVERGDLPKPDAWVFADTGDEPDSVYRQVEWAETRIHALGSELVTVKHKSGLALSQHVLSAVKTGETVWQPPYFIEDSDNPGRRMPARRECTDKFKIEPIRKWIRQRFEPKMRRGAEVIQWLGISVDEAHRMKPSGLQWLQNQYPLIDLGLHRSDCLKLLSDLGVTAPRSACVYCPFHSNREWKRLQETEPKAFAAAIRFEQQLHALHAAGHRIAGLDQAPTLHRSGEMLSEIDFTAQQELFGNWGNECGGVCGV
jgi:hypothetical protein